MKYLNQSTRFRCARLPTPTFQASCQGNKMVTIGGQPILNTSAVINCILPGSVCPSLSEKTGSPVPCSATGLSGSWVMASTAVKAGGLGLLTDKSYIICPLAGAKISPVQGTNVMTARSLAAIPSVPAGSVSAGHSSASSKPEARTSASTEHSSAQAQASSPGMSGAQTIAAPASGTAVSTDVQQTSEEERCASFLCKCGGDPALCPDGRFQSCRYAAARQDCLVPENSSVQLGKAICSEGSDCAACGLLRQRCSVSRDDSPELLNSEKHIRTSVRATYHHMVSTSAANSVSSFVRLANFLGYNTNRAGNGICLPRPFSPQNINKNDGTIYRERIIMRLTRMQMHRTQHAYSLSEAECFRLRRRLEQLKADPRFSGREYRAALSYVPRIRSPEFHGVSGYYRPVTDLLEQLVDMISDKYSGCCFEAERENILADFEAGMDYIEKQIRGRINAFSTDPLLSAPFFLSKGVLMYAYGLKPDDG